MNTPRNTLAASLLIPLLSACVDGPARVHISLTGVSNQVAAKSLDASDAEGAPVLIDSAFANVRHIQLDIPEDSEGCVEEELEAPVLCESGKVVVEGPFVFDLMTGASTPSLDEVTLPSGTYKRIDVRLDDAEPSDGLVEEDDAMAELSLLVRGAVDVDGDLVEFGLALQFNEDARFEEQGGILVEGDSTLPLSLNVAEWFDGVDLAACIASDEIEPGDNGVYWIDEDVSGGDCSDVERDLKENIKESGQIDGA